MSAAQLVLAPLLAVLGLGAVLVAATLPLGAAAQGVLALGAAVVGCGLATAWLRARMALPVLLALSGALSLRYLAWRLASVLDTTLHPTGWLALALLVAECVAVGALWMVLARSAWPLRRPPRPLPADPLAWPAVDVFVVASPAAAPPAVRDSVLAALGLDWPPGRLTVWLLDGAARPPLRDFAEASGARYLAPAASLNDALAQGAAGFVAVFEPGDMPTRAFLQLTLGWMLARPDLAFVQSEVAPRTQGSRLQDGSDTLAATRLAGSGAVLRRAALRGAGGFAATAERTTRRLRQRGWNGAFLAAPLAGGASGARYLAPRHWLPLVVLAGVPVLLLAVTDSPLTLAAYAAPHWLLAMLAAAAVSAAPAPRRASAKPVVPVRITLPDGTAAAAQAHRLAADGATLSISAGAVADLAKTLVRLDVTLGDEVVRVPANIAAIAGGSIEITWAPQSLADEARVVRVVYGRADAWVGQPPVRPILRRLLAASLLCSLATLAPAHAQAPPPAAAGASDYTVRPIPGGAAETVPQGGAGPADTRTVVYTLHQLGAAGPLALRGTQPLLAVGFGVRADEVVTAATLNLEGAVSPALLPALSNVTVTLNGQYVATIPADRHTPAFTAEVPLTPALLQATDSLEFRLAGRAQADCDDPLSPLLWATIADSSTLTLTLARLPPERDLGRLPRPFFDTDDPAALALPFVLPAAPDDETLRAAGIAASWFGQLAGARSARFAAATALPDSGNAVVVQVDADAGGVPGAPAIDGPLLAVLANPHDPYGSVLLIAGRSPAEATIAARALAFGIRALAGSAAHVQPPDIAARLAYDAPAWIATDHPVRLGALAAAAALQGSGYVSQITLPWHVAPDLWTWRDRPFALDLRWRAPPGAVIDAGGSRLDVGLDGDYLASLALAGTEAAAQRQQVAVPAYDVSGNDTLRLFFDARPARRAACAAIPGDLRMAVDADSTLDLSRAYHVAHLPELGFFASTGFPFTRMADLSQTAVVLPEQPSAAELGGFLDMMGRLAAATGLPGGAVTVVRPGEVASVADRDFLVIGTLAGLQSAGLAGLLDASPVGFADGRLHVKLGDAAAGASRGRAATAVSAGFAGGLAVLVGAPSPLRAGRSVVALIASDAASLQAGIDALGDPERQHLVHGDLALLSGGQVSAYRIGPTYTMGDLPFWLWPSWYLADQPWPALAILLAGSLFLGVAMLWWFRRRAAARLAPR